MAEGSMGKKKGHLRVTIDVEINEELLDTMKEGMANLGQHMPKMMRRADSTDEASNRAGYSFLLIFPF